MEKLLSMSERMNKNFDSFYRYETEIKEKEDKIHFVDLDEDTRRYEVVVPGFHKSEIKVNVYDSDRIIAIYCKNDTNSINLEFEIEFEFDDVEARLENGILYISVERWEDEPYEVEID